MLRQITATGGRAASQLQTLRNAGYVEYWDDPDNPTGPDRVRITEAGKDALAATWRR
jgi:DNA-binding PadR family transcriptional regulator